MSTKSTVCHGDGWHLYREVFDLTVHLSIEEPLEIEFQATPFSIDVMIPKEVITYVRKALRIKTLEEVAKAIKAKDFDKETVLEEIERMKRSEP